MHFVPTRIDFESLSILIPRLCKWPDAHAIAISLIGVVIECQHGVVLAQYCVRFGDCLCRTEDFLYFVGNLQNVLPDHHSLVTVRHHASFLIVEVLTIFYSPLQVFFKIIAYIGVVLGTGQYVGTIVNGL